jgi:hypothetical protein
MAVSMIGMSVSMAMRLSPDGCAARCGRDHRRSLQVGQWERGAGAVSRKTLRASSGIAALPQDVRTKSDGRARANLSERIA